MNLGTTETILTVIAAVAVSGLLGFAWWLGEPEKSYGRRVAHMRRGGRWCVAADRGLFGYQVVQCGHSKDSLSKWRHQNRAFYTDTLFILREGYIDSHNAELMKSPEYWAFLNKFIEIVDEAEWQAAKAAKASDDTQAFDSADLAQSPMPIVPSGFREKPGEEEMQRLDAAEDGIRRVEHDTDAIMIALDGMEQQARELREGVKRVHDRLGDGGPLPPLPAAQHNDALHHPRE
jgi:hypothetical protein